MPDIIKPLSSRLLNDQGIVNFKLLDISQDKLAVSVAVKEADQQYVGHVKLLEGSTVEAFREKLEAYEAYQVAMAKWEAQDAEAKAEKKAPDLVAPVMVTINRVTHAEFPFMK